MTKKPGIAIIGANESINFLIEKAKSKGYETHVFAWECGDPGEKSADNFYPISIDDKERILDICKGLGICGVASITSDFAVNTVNYVARNLGLVCNSEKTDSVARNKYLMRKAFKDAGLFTPFFMKVDTNTDVSELSGLIFPLIVKPTDRWSSKGVTRVNSFAALSDAVAYAVSESLTGEAIIEGFMDGPEFSAECICQDGVCNVLAITEKITTGFPNYVEVGHIQPAKLTPQQMDEVIIAVKKAVAALDIRNSAAHVEFKITELGNIGIIEVGARMGGDFIGTDLVRLSTGYDYVGMVIDVACGKPIVFDKSEHYAKVKVRFLMNEKDLLDFNHNDSIKASLERIVVYSENFSHPVMNSSDRYGYYIVRN